MELSYIWVSAFRNIRDQGFLFSSRFNISYDRERNQVQLSLNLNYINDFFGHQVSTVTGIVGENAAGKTNLLELINCCLDGGNTRIAAPCWCEF